jgi:membrane protein implicated in regulation of membrane protease activity
MFTLAVAIVVGAVVSLATGSWWFLILAIAVHVVATTLVMTSIRGRLRQEEKPDPVTEARLADEHRA